MSGWAQPVCHLASHLWAEARFEPAARRSVASKPCTLVTGPKWLTVSTTPRTHFMLWLWRSPAEHPRGHPSIWNCTLTNAFRYDIVHWHMHLTSAFRYDIVHWHMHLTSAFRYDIVHWHMHLSMKLYIDKYIPVWYCTLTHAFEYETLHWQMYSCMILYIDTCIRVWNSTLTNAFQYEIVHWHMHSGMKLYMTHAFQYETVHWQMHSSIKLHIDECMPLWTCALTNAFQRIFYFPVTWAATCHLQRICLQWYFISLSHGQPHAIFRGFVSSDILCPCHGQPHAIFRGFVSSDILFPCHMGSHMPSSEDLSPVLEGEHCYAKSFLQLKMVPTYAAHNILM